MNTIIAAFCDRAAANEAVAMLDSRGITNAEIFATDGSATNILPTLTSLHVPDDRAQLYAEVMRRGAVILAAHTDSAAGDVADDLDRMGSLDLDAAAARWRESGWTGYDVNALPYDADACARERSSLLEESGYGESTRLDASTQTEAATAKDVDVVEERVTVGKREVPRGGVRVRTFIVERPVHEEIELREERVDVERERVDERVSPGAIDTTLSEDEFVVTAHGEEAVVGKEARVVERVHVGKTADTRTETIEETERRRDVEVEPVTQTDADRTAGRRR